MQAAQMMQTNPEERLGSGFLEVLEDPELAKKELSIALINKKLNRELLEDVPHFDFLDLAAIAVLQHGKTSEYACTVHRGMMQNLSMTRESLMEAACLNTFRRFPTQLTITQGLQVAFCKNSLFGAACLLDINMLKTVSKQMDSDILIIPESLRSIILVPAEENDAEHVRESHQRIILMDGSVRDYLSDNIYRFSREEMKLTVYGGLS